MLRYLSLDEIKVNKILNLARRRAPTEPGEITKK